MTTLSYASIKTSSTAKENEEKRRDAREKAMLLFAFQLLVDKGYVATASTFASECSLDLGQYVMCENIDLQSIFLEFESYHNLKFQRYPQYFRKLSSGMINNGESLLSKLQSQTKQNCSKARGLKPRRAQLESEDSNVSNGFDDIAPSVKKLENANGSLEPTSDAQFEGQLLDGKLLKPISGLDFLTDDMRLFAEMIQKEIVLKDLGVTWNDVIGLDNAKMILMESLVYAKQFSDFFGAAFPPWRGLLMYGPPGNGKTLLAKATANECKSTFFNISSSSIVSKWRGDSEKLLKILFDIAKYHAPSTIFFDEFDALGASRDFGGESDASRRLKSELLQQLDGLLSQQRDNNAASSSVFILAATNIPWDLDPAILRRFEKRICVPLPDSNERREILRNYVGKAIDSVTETSRGMNSIICNVDFKMLASLTEGYTSSDLHQIVKESIVRKFREQFNNKIKKLIIETSDMMLTVKSIPPTVTPQLNEKFSNWDKKFGTA